tara:strand:+ start:727 stop:1302 length:576 start_codon:yes stop_codon:yes gene_type:complete
MIPKYIYEIPSLMSASDLESVYELVYNLPKNSDILEVGCFLGSVTCTIKEACNSSKLYCVDIWDDEIHENYLKGYDRKTINEDIKSNVNEWRKNTNHLNNVYMYQHNSLAVEFDTKFDFIFLDGNHTYNNVRAELIKYSKYLKPNGFIAGHDYGIAPCTKAITEFATNNNLAVWTMKDSIWYYKPYKVPAK